ncbi:MAG: phosphate signaling complex protein PhoU [Maricaulaceae bacterium]
MSLASDHIVQAYDEELNALAAQLSEMGGLVESMIKDSMKAVRKGDIALAKDVIARDHAVNKMQDEIDANALRLLALRHPMATDLRRVIGAIRAANDIERIGDLAEGIAKRALTITISEASDQASSIRRMGKLVKTQVKNALDALLSENAEQAMQVWLADKDIDDLYASIFRELLTFMMQDHRNIQTCTSLLFVAKNLERIGDQATNISETVYFSVHGSSLALEAAERHDDNDDDE